METLKKFIVWFAILLAVIFIARGAQLMGQIWFVVGMLAASFASNMTNALFAEHLKN